MRDEGEGLGLRCDHHKSGLRRCRDTCYISLQK